MDYVFIYWGVDWVIDLLFLFFFGLVLFDNV